MHVREVLTCIRCRESKRRCDKTRPACTRCKHAGVSCSYQPTIEKTDFLQENGRGIDENGHLDDILQLELSPNRSIETAPFVRDESNDTPMTDAPEERNVKKRNRACLSCTRCHRLKIKCDKKQPCGRCVLSNQETTCMYTHRSHLTSLTPDIPYTSAGENIEGVIATWVLRHRGSSNWQALLSKAESFDRLRLTSIMNTALRDQEHGHGTDPANPILPGNYPIGSPEAASYSSMSSVLTLIENHRQSYEVHIRSYFDLYQPVYPLIEESSFLVQMETFWSNPSETNFAWLSQFLVVLGLGIFATTRSQESSLDCFFAAEACLSKTPFMFRPTILSTRTLCLMVVAKQAVNATCWALDSCWNVMGIIVRLAVMLGLHCGGRVDLTDTERQSGRHLWTMIVYLELQLSLITGEPSLLPAEGLLRNNETWSTNNEKTIWDSILPESFPIISHFLSRLNSNTDIISYDEILQYDTEMRRRMNSLAINKIGGIRGIALDIFYRRVLSSLHRSHALHPEAPTIYSTSYWSSLECALAQLLHYLELNDQSQLPANRDLMVRPFMLDFSSASLTVCLHLARTDAPLSESDCDIPPRQTIIHTIKSCLDILSTQKEYSLCYRSGYRLLKSVYNAIPDVAASGNYAH